MKIIDERKVWEMGTDGARNCAEKWWGLGHTMRRMG